MSKDALKTRLVDVTVNGIKIKIHSPATGIEIKQAAIDAGLRIKLDSLLELQKGEETVQIGDDQKITVEGGASFVATAREQPEFCLDIEGTLKPWYHSTITTEQIIALGGWDPSLGALVIDADNNERTLAPGETIELKPGMGFSKKIRFKRGWALFRYRNNAHYADVGIMPMSSLMSPSCTASPTRVSA